MKQVTIAVTLILFIALKVSAQNTDLSSQYGIPPGLSGNYGTEQGKVAKVFSAEDASFRFRAYQSEVEESGCHSIGPAEHFRLQRR